MKEETDVILLVLAIIIVVGALIGSLFSFRVIKRRQKALKSARQDDPLDPLLIALAESGLATEINRFLTQTILLLVGAFAIVPDPPDWLRVILRVMLVAAIALIYVNSYLTDRADEVQWKLSAEAREAKNGKGVK